MDPPVLLLCRMTQSRYPMRGFRSLRYWCVILLAVWLDEKIRRVLTVYTWCFFELLFDHPLFILQSILPGLLKRIFKGLIQWLFSELFHFFSQGFHFSSFQDVVMDFFRSFRIPPRIPSKPRKFLHVFLKEFFQALIQWCISAWRCLWNFENLLFQKNFMGSYNDYAQSFHKDSYWD